MFISLLRSIPYLLIDTGAIFIFGALQIILSTRTDRRYGFIVPSLYLLSALLLMIPILIRNPSDFYGIPALVTGALIGCSIFYMILYALCGNYLKHKAKRKAEDEYDKAKIRDL